MEKINFEDLPSTDTPIDSTNLNLLQTNTENAINSLDNDLQSQINSIGKKLFPIGSIFISVTNTNPSSFLGGTWQSFGAGRTLVGVDTSQTEFNTVQKTGGSKTHTLTIEQIPSHSHSINLPFYNYQQNGNGFNGQVYKTSNVSQQNSLKTNTSGNGNPHNNLQPYITVYFWRRTA